VWFLIVRIHERPYVLRLIYAHGRFFTVYVTGRNHWQSYCIFNKYILECCGADETIVQYFYFPTLQSLMEQNRSYERLKIGARGEHESKPDDERVKHDT